MKVHKKRVEGNNYDSRKQVLQYDDVIREQREVIYAQRQEVILATEDMTPVLMGMFKRTIDRQVDGHELAGSLKDEENVKISCKHYTIQCCQKMALNCLN